MEKVLIVDDDIMLQKFLEKRMQRHATKFKTIHAFNGEEAIEILKKRYIALLVTDVVMPKLDGLALLTYIHNNYPQVQCIVMTGSRSQLVKKKLQNDNIFRLFHKPFHFEALTQAILQALDQDVPEGVLKGISGASFLQMIEMEEKTCLFEVKSGEKKGIFYFQEGILFEAACGKLKGDEAALEIIGMKNAEIRFKKAPTGKLNQNIKKPLTALIMEVMRRKDEAGG